MNMRERMLALVRGEEHDRVPFVQYSGIAAPDEAVWRAVGRENCGTLRWASVYTHETPNCSWESEDLERKGLKGVRQRLHTPEGSLESVSYFEPVFNSASQEEHFVKEPADYKALMAYFRDIVVRKDAESVRAAIAAVGDDGLPHTSVVRTPYQQLWVQWVSMEDLPLHLMLEPDLMAEVTALMEDVQRRVYEQACAVVKELPVPYIVVPDNITAPVIGETFYRQFCVPAYAELAGMLAETGLDIPVFVHMDGDLKPLWDAIDGRHVRGLDSMSPPPDNDTTVAEALRRWPEMRVCINFPSSVHLASPEVIRAATTEILEQGAGSQRLQIQVSENVPPDKWEASFCAITEAIREFQG